MKNNGQSVAELNTNSNFIIALIKGVLMALALSIIGVCVFAFILRFIDITDSLIKPVNMIIKIVSTLFGCMYGLKKECDMGLVKGLAIGASYSFFAFLLFSLLAGNFNFSVTVLNDVLFGSLIGAISGIIAVNFKKK